MKNTAVLMLICILTGCTTEVKHAPVEVTGEIIYNSEKVAEGIISFVPEGGGTSYGGGIKDGVYKVYPDTGIKPGRYKVEIRWGKATGEKNPNAGYGQSPDIFAEALPDKYNKETTLIAELKEGSNIVDFKLEK